jgi:hypothetical protein
MCSIYILKTQNIKRRPGDYSLWIFDMVKELWQIVNLLEI